MVQKNHQKGEGENDNRKILSVDSRSLRDLGGSYGISIDKEALDELDLIDENGNPNASAREIIYDDGSGEFVLERED